MKGKAKRTNLKKVRPNAEALTFVEFKESLYDFVCVKEKRKKIKEKDPI